MSREDKEILRKLFLDYFGPDISARENSNKEPEVKKLAGGGSPRRYYRLQSGDLSAIGVAGDDISENESFLNLDKCLKRNGINVPEIYNIGEGGKYYLIEDLGDVSLFSLLDSTDGLRLARKALEILVKIQSIPENEWINETGFKPFSSRLVRWDLNYFKYDYLKPSGLPFDEEKLEDDFDLLDSRLNHAEIYSGLMYRDFQSRNIMVKEGDLYFIDFQGARKGPMAYDAVSFIWQAKAPFTFTQREELGEFYADLLSRMGYDKSKVKRELDLMLVFRTLQVLGAYGFRGLIERKPHFIESLPLAIQNLKYIESKGLLNDYPEISRIAKNLMAATTDNENENEQGLIVSVGSFSFKKGYPEQIKGNGGGFMFDCRGIHNPGRYEEYKQLTGRDKEVINFLEKTNEASDFIKKAVDIVSPSIERYLQRGFTSLQVGFGCTGGRHRSVYCAEKFARAIKKMYPEIRVHLLHREQNISETL